MPEHRRSLQTILYDRLEKSPDRKALTFYDINGQFHWYTFSDLTRLATRYAWCMADLGVQRGDVCLLVLHSTEYSAHLLYATLLLGGLPLLIAPPALQGGSAFSNLAQVISHVIGKTHPRLVVCSDTMTELRTSFPNLSSRTRLVFESELTPADDDAPLPRLGIKSSEWAAMQLTSGTTGMPKVCVWSQKSVMAALDGMAKAMKLNQEDVYLNWTPLYHDMGLVNNFFLCMAKDIPLVMLTPVEFVKKPAIWLRSLSETGSTLTWSPNFGFAITAQRVRDSELQDVRLDGVRGFYNAAERIHHESFVSFYERFAPYGLRKEALKTNFGCAENIGGATFSDPDKAYLVERIDRDLFQNKRIARSIDGASPGSKEALTIVGVGRPHPDMSAYILNRQGKPLPDGHVGEIGLKTPSKMEGYLRDARATRRALFNGYLRTGDLGYMRNGEVFWVGRVRERITVRGVKLDPSDFEPVLLQIPDLRSGCFAAFGIDDEMQGTQQIVIVTEVKDSTIRTPLDISSEVRQKVFESLGINISEVMLVRQGTLTKTSSGKRRHKHFREVYIDGGLDQFEWTPEAASNTSPD